MDGKSPEFHFFCPRLRVNKRILQLCIGTWTAYVIAFEREDSFLSVYMYVCACMYVRGRERERDRGSGIALWCICVDYVERGLPRGHLQDELASYFALYIYICPPTSIHHTLRIS